MGLIGGAIKKGMNEFSPNSNFLTLLLIVSVYLIIIILKDMFRIFQYGELRI